MTVGPRGPHRLELVVLIVFALFLGGAGWLWLGHTLEGFGARAVIHWDTDVGRWVGSRRDSFGMEFWERWTLLGDPWLLAWAVVLAGAGFCATRRFFEAWLLWLGSAAGAALVEALKYLVDRPRPPLGLILETPAFPSGHASVSVIIYGLILAFSYGELRSLWMRALVPAFWTAVLLGIGWSRLYLGVHWVSDVLGGWCLGGIWLLFLILLWRLYRRRHPVPVLAGGARTWAFVAGGCLTLTWCVMLLQIVA